MLIEERDGRDRSGRMEPGTSEGLVSDPEPVNQSLESRVLLRGSVEMSRKEESVKK